jgi:hypothetical protein
MSISTVSTTTPHVNGSIHKIEVSWDDALSGHFPDSPARTAWREAILAVAENARAKLPQCASRITAAVKIVLSGDVEIRDDGTAQVRSHQGGKTVYHVANGSCTCPDYRKAFEGWCKHRIAHAIYRRARAQVAQQLQDLEAPAQETTHQHAPEAPIAPPVDSPAIPAREITHTEAPASANTYLTIQGYRVQLTVRGVNEQDVLARLLTVLAQYPLPTEAQAPQDLPEGWCRRHNVQMTEHFKEDRSWFSHYVDGKWCRGK